jgi:hypothetical protein
LLHFYELAVLYDATDGPVLYQWFPKMELLLNTIFVIGVESVAMVLG